MSNSFNNSGNISGANINVGSTLTNVVETVQTMPGASQSDKETLEELMQKLKTELEKIPQVAPEQADDAEKVALRTKQLVEEASVAKPDKEEVADKGEKLKKAAENLGRVLPIVLSLATQVVSTVSNIVK